MEELQLLCKRIRLVSRSCGQLPERLFGAFLRLECGYEKAARSAPVVRDELGTWHGTRR